MQGCPKLASLNVGVADLFADVQNGAVQRDVVAGTMLFKAESPADRVYMIVHGQIRVYQDGPDGSTSGSRLAWILGPGEWFGITSLRPNTACGKRAVAAVNSVLSEIPSEKFRCLLAQHPLASLEVINTLSDRLQVALEDSARMVFDDCNARLVKTLVRFSSSAAATRKGDNVILRITHQQLAQAVGVARETVSLALTQLRRRGLLQTGRNQVIFNPDPLSRALPELA